jgi:hypothetical protein
MMLVPQWFIPLTGDTIAKIALEIQKKPGGENEKGKNTEKRGITQKHRKSVFFGAFGVVSVAWGSIDTGMGRLLGSIDDRRKRRIRIGSA